MSAHNSFTKAINLAWEITKGTHASEKGEVAWRVRIETSMFHTLQIMILTNTIIYPEYVVVIIAFCFTIEVQKVSASICTKYK